LFDCFFPSFFHCRQIGQRQLCFYRLDIPDGIERPFNVSDAGCLKAADDLDEGVYFADVREELVAESFPAMSQYSIVVGTVTSVL